MSVTLKGRLFFTRDGDKEETIEYFKKIGIASMDMINNKYEEDRNCFYRIELKEKPSIIDTLELCGYFEIVDAIEILKVTEYGIAFYLVDQYMADGFLFVPMSNVIGIHTINKYNIDGLIKRE
ncbi:hypothetical protein JOC70_000724 [Clostridium pascui]|uniref:hypothetical protein n=1 Tax=Clostridium pascui TaxID=46609 RepID=UPI00195EC0A9|nr:hypothetical protein [Clostridium pascui]MBM7869255.1 hypothetical protein [Clostridium pascui]